jgi:hypothetical protein
MERKGFLADAAAGSRLSPPHIAGRNLTRYALESGRREDHRRVDSGTQVKSVLAMACKPSVDFCGYWQQAQKSPESKYGRHTV